MAGEKKPGADEPRPAEVEDLRPEVETHGGIDEADLVLLAKSEAVIRWFDKIPSPTPLADLLEPEPKK